MVAMSRGRTPALAGMGALDWLLVAIAGLANVLIWGAIVLRQRAIAHGRCSTLGADLLRPVARLLPTLGMGVASLAAIALGTVLLVVPGIYLSVALLFAYPALLLDDASLAGSMRTSLALVRGNNGAPRRS